MARIKGTFARDSLSGTEKNDKILGDRGDDGLFGGLGNDQLRGGQDNDYLSGGEGNDRMFGEAGEDYLHGGAGDDILNGGSSGFSDYDFVEYYGGIGVTVNLATGVATDEFGDTDTLIDIEAVAGTGGADTMIGGNKANDDFESFRGFDGADSIDGGSGYDRVDYGRDWNVNSGTGRGGIVADFVAGTVRDGFGNIDTIKNIEAIRSSMFSDDLRGDKNDNVFNPLSGSDYIDGRGGVDTVSYNSDHYYDDRNGGGTGIRADLRAGEIQNTTGYQIDTVKNIENVTGSVLDDAIYGNAAANGLRGGNGSDLLVGRAGADNLNGENGQDALNGGAGNDILNGGEGNDKLWGRKGSDTFVFETDSGIDIVRDFSHGEDQLDLSALGFARASNVIEVSVQTGNAVTINLDDDNAIILKNTSFADLDASDFIL